MNSTNRSTLPKLLTASQARPEGAPLSGGVPEEFAQAIRDCAKRDAHTGAYLGAGYAAMEKEYLEANVSPDRKSAMAQLAHQISLPGASGDTEFSFLCDTLGLPYKGKVQRGLVWTTAEAYDEHGETIVTYHSGAGGWQGVPTSAEEHFRETAGSIYRIAYREAKSGRPQGQVKNAYVANMNAAQAGTPASRGELTAMQAASLTQRYSIHALSRSAYGNLLKELRDTGIISEQEFSIGYAGSLPRTGSPAKAPEWPLGDRTADFRQLLHDSALFCGKVYDRTGSPQASALAQTYGSLYRVFTLLEQSAG